MLMAVDSPDLQVVPADTAMTVDQAPLAHCWNDVPPIQFHIPSVVQAVPAVKAPAVEVVPVLAGVDAEATGVEATGATDEALGEEDTTGAGAEVATGVFEVATVAKTPPETAGAETATEAAEVALETTAEVGLVPVPAVPVAAMVDPQAAPLGSTGVAVELPSRSRESPGDGNFRSVESTVLQSLPMLAVNMFGRALNAAVSRSMS
jgi:hypothetical protein